MKRLGTIKVFTNKRLTLPEDFVKEMNVEDGDYIDLFLSDDGQVILRLEKGIQAGKKKNK